MCDFLVPLLALGQGIGRWGNFVNRTLSFIKSKFDGKINKFDVEKEIKNRIIKTFNISADYIEKGKISSALRVILELVDYSNKYFNTTEPWKVIKEDKKHGEELCYQYLTLIANISILLNPFIPNGTKRVADWIGIGIKKYNFIEIDNVELEEFKPLYERIPN